MYTTEELAQIEDAKNRLPSNEIKKPEELAAEQEAADQAAKLAKEEIAKEESERLEQETIEKAKLENEDTTEETPFKVLNAKYDIEYEWNEEDDAITQVTNFVEAALTISSKRERTAALKELFEERPDLQLAYEGASNEEIQIKGVLSQYQTLELNDDLDDENNLEILKNVYKQSLISKGSDEETANELVVNAEQSGKLVDKAKAGKEFIIKTLEKQAYEFDKQRTLEAKQYEDNQKAIHNQIREVITKGEIAFDKKEEGDAFYNYITKEIDKKGNTAADISYNNLTLQQRMKVDLYIKNGLKDTTKTGAATSKTSLKDLVNKNGERKLIKGNEPSGKEKVVNINDLESILQKASRA